MSTKSEINEIQTYIKRCFNSGNVRETATSNLAKLNSEEKSILITEGYVEKTDKGIYTLRDKGKTILQDTSYMDEVDQINFRNTCELLKNCYNNDYNFHNLSKTQRDDMKINKLVSRFIAGIPLLGKVGVNVLGITDQIAIYKYLEYRDKFWEPIQEKRRVDYNWNKKRHKQKRYNVKEIIIS